MDGKKVLDAISNAQKELNTLTDSEYAEAKKTGRNFKRLEMFGQATKSLLAAERNVEKAIAAEKQAAERKTKPAAK